MSLLCMWKELTIENITFFVCYMICSCCWTRFKNKIPKMNRSNSDKIVSFTKRVFELVLREAHLSIFAHPKNSFKLRKINCCISEPIPDVSRVNKHKLYV